MGEFIILVKLKMNGYVLSTVAADALVLKHQVICVHSADQIYPLYGTSLIQRDCIYIEPYMK